MKRLVLIISVLLSLIPIEIAHADSANPPRVFSVKIVDVKTSYTAGDEIVYEFQYSGGNPGIKSLEYGLSPISGGICVGTNNFLYWSESTAKNYSTTDVGPISNSRFRLSGTVTSDCKNGLNEFGLSFLSMTDKTDLKYEAFFRAPSFNVTDGKFIPPGTFLGNLRATTLSLDFLQSSYEVDENKSLLVSLPKKNSDGILITYNAFWGDVCRISRDSSGYGSILEIVKSGTCEVQANVALTRSEFVNTQLSKRISISSRAAAELKAKQEAEAKAAAELKAKQEAEAKAAADAKTAAELKAKQDAEAKAAAEIKAKEVAEAEAKIAAEQKAKQEAESKAAAELKAKQDAEAKAAAIKKTTITCMKGKLTKKVIAVKPKCPTGYKLKK
jgi:hypothetical protein